MTDIRTTDIDTTNKTTDTKRKEPDRTVAFLDGNTTVIVGMHFAKKGRVTLEDKVKRLILADVRANNF